MAWRHCDGFDVNDTQGMGIKYLPQFTATGVPAISSQYGFTTAGNPGPAGSGPNGQSVYIRGDYEFTRILDAQPTWFVGFDFARYNEGIVTDTQGGDFYRFSTAAGSVLKMSFSLDGTGRITVRTGSLCSTPNTVLATSLNSFTLFQFGFLELVMTFGATIGYEIYYNDTLVPKQGGGNMVDSNLSLGSSALPDRLTHLRTQEPGGSFTGIAFDNYYICDAQSDGTIFNQRLGPLRITTLSPASDATVQWTRNAGSSNFVAVDDIPNVAASAPDGNITMLTPNAVSALALFGLAKSPCFGLNLGVALNLCARPISGSPTIRMVSRGPDGVVQLGLSTVVNPGTIQNQAPAVAGFHTYQAYAPLNSATGQPWNDAQIDGLAWGAQCDPSVTTLQLTQVYMEKLTSLRSSPFDCGQASYSFGK